jgi:hypothetical protein
MIMRWHNNPAVCVARVRAHPCDVSACVCMCRESERIWNKVRCVCGGEVAEHI